uniref:indole-3-glycerol-phosphate synthase n=1 Tax=Archaeoglobus fulgidus TaxID=2234 RepID=A0A7J2TI90_ARCFL
MDFGFRHALRVKDRNAIIGEIKCHSPTHGDLIRGRDPVEIARVYEKCGCCAVSYITSPVFRGNLRTLKEICREVGIPVLRKDFIKDRVEVERTCDAGADALLLIARILRDKTPEFVDLCFEHGLEPVVEIFDEEEIEFAENAEVVLLNNRDIFNPSDVRLERTLKLAPKIKKIKIGASGIRRIEDLFMLKFVDAVLIGTHFMVSENLESTVRSFVEARV